VIETHLVRTAHRPEPVPVTLKLDSASGEVWRFTGADFRQVAVAQTLSTSIDDEADLDEQRQREAVQRKLDQIIIPEVSLREASLRDAIAFLSDASRKHDPGGNGVNLCVNAGSMQTQVNDPFAPVAEDSRMDTTRVSFDGKKVAVGDALVVVAAQAGLTYRIRSNLVIVGPQVSSEDFVHRVYDLLPSTMDRLRDQHPGLFEANVPASVLDERWKTYLQPYGVTWPTESSIQVFPDLGKIGLRNTSVTLAIFEQVLSALNSFPPHPGRFRLVALGESAAEGPTLLLLDSDTGDTWHYEVDALDDATQQVQDDRFLAIPARRTKRD
jgi:hypothetical protein